MFLPMLGDMVVALFEFCAAEDGSKISPPAKVTIIKARTRDILLIILNSSSLINWFFRGPKEIYSDRFYEVNKYSYVEVVFSA